MTPTSPVVGAPVTGLTSPTYSLVGDVCPSQNGQQWAITACGGTQTGVEVHSASKPFTVAVYRPGTLKLRTAVDPVTGQLQSNPKNTYAVVVRKGVTPLAGQPAVVALCRCQFEIPAGSDLADPEDLSALMSFVGGFLYANASALANTVKTNIL